MIGAFVAARVAMTSMPELVAMLHSFVGAAAVIVGIATYLQPGDAYEAGRSAHLVEIYVGVLVGAVTFSGSIVAFGKLRGIIGSRPLLLPGRHILNLIVIMLCVALGVVFHHAEVPWPDAGADIVDAGMPALLAMTGLALLLGDSHGDGDRRRRHAGRRVAAQQLLGLGGGRGGLHAVERSADRDGRAGRQLGRDPQLHHVPGDEPLDLQRDAGRLRRRGGREAGARARRPAGKVTETNVNEVAEWLLAARHVVIVPGYGMAVAQAQHAVKEISSLLIEKGVTCRYAIHPVAGRLPGHMNVLLAEANVSYDIVKEMEEINPDFPETEVVMVIGANDIVNPSAETDTVEPDLRDAGAAGLEGGQGRHAQARHVGGLRGRRQPAGLQRQHRDAVRRRAPERPEAAGRAARRRRDSPAATWRGEGQDRRARSASR